MPNDPAVKPAEHTPIVSALLGLPGVTQIGHALGLIGSASPSSEPVDASASKVVASNNVHRRSLLHGLINSMGQQLFTHQQAASRKEYDGRGSGRENSPGAMAPATKASISVIAIGESTGATYTDFILSNIVEQDAEKVEVVETFGAFHLFASGRFARKYQFSGHVRAHPVNHAVTNLSANDIPAAVKLRNLYEEHLRATVQATRQTFTRITVDRDSYDGWITTLNLNRDAQSEFMVSFTFTMVAYYRSHEKDTRAKALLAPFGVIEGEQKKPIARLKAEKAAAVGACLPVWYINDAVATSAPSLEIAESDAGLSKLQGQHITLRSKSGDGTAVGGTCTLTAKVGGVAVELSDIGIAASLFNLTTPQTVFTQNVVFRKLFDIGGGKPSVLLEITAAGVTEAGAPTSAVFTIPLKVVGVSQTRVSGYNVYYGAGTLVTSKLVFPATIGTAGSYGPVTDDTVLLSVARFSVAPAPTEFKFSIEPLCVDAKTGLPVPTPESLHIGLAIVDAPDTNVAANASAVMAGRGTIGYKYTTDLEAPGGTTSLQQNGATGIELNIDTPKQDGFEAMPRATMRFKFPSLSAPFPVSSEMRVLPRASTDEPPTFAILMTVKPGMSAVAAVALAKKASVTAYLASIDATVKMTPESGTVALGLQGESSALGPMMVSFFMDSNQQQFVRIKSTATDRQRKFALGGEGGESTASVVMPLGIPNPLSAPGAFLFNIARTMVDS